MNSQTIRTVTQLISAICALGCMLIMSTANLCAQSVFGSIRGTTQDQSGAVLPQAELTLQNVGENTRAVTITDAAGNYLFENLSQDTTV